jgi:dUTP pyrophosphatase
MFTLNILDKTSDNFYKNHSTFNKNDSGIDLFFPEKILVKAGETKLISLKINIQMWNNNNNKYEASFLLPRSSIYKTPLRMANSLGLIDSEYTGEIKVAIDNIKNYDYTINKGDRLFQIIHPSTEPLNIQLVDKLRETTRGDKGFGSTNNT